jgi:tetratricopeptide (TPR) repeat protein
VQTAQAWWAEWIGIQVDRVMVNYWLAREDEIELLVSKIRAATAEQGSAPQRAQLFKSLTYLSMRGERYALSERTVSYARRRLEASIEWADESEIVEARFAFALALLFRGSHGFVEQAERELAEAIPSAERSGNLTILARFLTYRTVAQRRLGHADYVRETARRALDVAGAGEMAEYIGAARANLGWVAWKTGALAEARSQCEAAIEIWRRLSMVYPLQWMARFVLVAVDFEQADFTRAAEHATRMLEDKQQLLPPPLSEALARVASIANNEDEKERDVVAAIEAAKAHGFL